MVTDPEVERAIRRARAVQRLRTGAELLGFAALVAGAWTFSPALGLLALGVCLIIAANFAGVHRT